LPSDNGNTRLSIELPQSSPRKGRRSFLNAVTEYQCKVSSRPRDGSKGNECPKLGIVILELDLMKAAAKLGDRFLHSLADLI
jgi:hypothetical protein